MANDIFHKAARDGYVQLLQETTRRDCDRPDEDGRSPTLWAAACGNLDALRVVTSRGGNPDKSDHLGSTALHLAASKGHMNCVSYLVSFGANIWSMDNDFHTALDVASIQNRLEVIKFLDTVSAKQLLMNRKLVKKMKEKALLKAQRRVRRYGKMQKKAEKEALKEDKKLSKERSKMAVSANGHVSSVRIAKFKSDRGYLHGTQRSTFSEPMPYSAHFTENHNRKFIAGVAKKLKARSKSDNQATKRNGDFKVRNTEVDGTKTIKSLSGLRRDAYIMYVNGRDAESTLTRKSGSNFDLNSTGEEDKISRAFSEPDFHFGNNGDSGVETDSNPPEGASIFERPGFGSVAFMNRRMTTGALLSLPNASSIHNGLPQESSTDSPPAQTKKKTKNKNPKLSHKDKSIAGDGDSIGSVGTLALRMQKLSWDESDDESVLLDDDDVAQSSALELFLACNGLTELIPLFSREKVDLDALMLLTDTDFKELGLQLGPRRKLIEAVKQRQAILRAPGIMTDSML